MNFQKVPEGRPLRMAVIGAGNRANKYLEYARRHPERLQPVAVVDGNELRRNETAERFGLAAERRYADYDAFFARPPTPTPCSSPRRTTYTSIPA